MKPSVTNKLSLDRLQFERLDDRPSKVNLEHLGRVCDDNQPSIADFIDALPDQLAARSLRKLRDAILSARKQARGVAIAMGGHVIKTGCGPYLIDWIRCGLVTSVAMNGSAAIHDLELAIAGKTSEDVGPRLAAGTFGFARETSAIFANACDLAAANDSGLGTSLSEIVAKIEGPGSHASVLVAAYEMQVPITIHVAIGTDIVHMTGELDGAALGKAAMHDFRRLCQIVADLEHGVWINLGSAVVMPEIFLKAVSIARNLGRSLNGLTTANLDFEQKYRRMNNVLQRPGGEGIALTGCHEIMIPLLHSAVISRFAAINDHRVDQPQESHSHLRQPTSAETAAR